jgi:hypothetical protein
VCRHHSRRERYSVDPPHGESQMPDLTLTGSSDNVAVILPPNCIPEWQLVAEQ